MFVHIQRLNASVWVEVAQFIIDPLLETSKLMMSGIDILCSLGTQATATHV
jgi:hypothetical protein